ncbi:hypothetical protein ACFFRR_004023 [Megaselia abdita]
MKNEKKPRNFWSTAEIRCMLDLIKDLQTKTGTTATTHHIFVQIQNEMARRGYRTKNAIQIRRKWFQMKSAYHCSKKGNNDRIMLIPEEFREDIRDFVESESKGWWKIRKNEVVPEPGTCEWFNPNTTANGDADDEAEQTMMEGEADPEDNTSPYPLEYPPDIEIKPEPEEYSEMPEDYHQSQDEEPIPGPSTSSPPISIPLPTSQMTQMTFPMASVSAEYKKTKRKRKDIVYEQTPDMMQEKTEEETEEGGDSSFPRSYQKKFLKFTNRCLNVEKTVQQEFLKQQWQLMKHEHKLQAERDQMIIDSFQRATDEILEMSRTMLQDIFYNHNDDK